MTDEELNAAVAKACGYTTEVRQGLLGIWKPEVVWIRFNPLQLWEQCGPLIARFDLFIEPQPNLESREFEWDVGARNHPGTYVPFADDPDAALRRAICLAVTRAAREAEYAAKFGEDGAEFEEKTQP